MTLVHIPYLPVVSSTWLCSAFIRGKWWISFSVDKQSYLKGVSFLGDELLNTNLKFSILNRNKHATQRCYEKHISFPWVSQNSNIISWIKAKGTSAHYIQSILLHIILNNWVLSCWIFKKFSKLTDILMDLLSLRENCVSEKFWGRFKYF